jgi:hypothetical protein
MDLEILTGDGDHCGDVRGDQDKKWKQEHADQTECGVELLLPRLRVESEGHALVELFVERPFLHMKDHQL